MNQMKEKFERIVLGGDEDDDLIEAARQNMHLADYLNLSVTSLEPKLQNYDGFNVGDMYKKIMKKMLEKTVFGSVAKDIRFGIVLFNERGNKILSKRTPELAKMNRQGFNDMKKWSEYYCVESFAREPNTLTPAKWSLVFPLSACGYSNIQKSWIIQPPIDVPKCIYCHAFSSLIINNTSLLNEIQTRLLMKAAAYYQYQLSEIIGKPVYKSHSVDEKKKKSFQYVEYWSKNSIESNEDKLKFLVEQGILERRGRQNTYEVTPVVFALATKFDKIV